MATEHENGNAAENTAVVANAIESPVADPKGKGKGKAVATPEDAPKDMAVDDDDDDDEEDEDEVSLNYHCVALHCNPHKGCVLLTNLFDRLPTMVRLISHMIN